MEVLPENVVGILFFAAWEVEQVFSSSALKGVAAAFAANKRFVEAFFLFMRRVIVLSSENEERTAGSEAF